MSPPCRALRRLKSSFFVSCGSPQWLITHLFIREDLNDTIDFSISSDFLPCKTADWMPRTCSQPTGAWALGRDVLLFQVMQRAPQMPGRWGHPSRRSSGKDPFRPFGVQGTIQVQEFMHCRMFDVTQEPSLCHNGGVPCLCTSARRFAGKRVCFSDSVRGHRIHSLQRRRGDTDALLSD